MLRNVKEKGRKKQEKGITLIALIITIIVLLILSGISIAMLTGDNGILNKAAEAKVQTEIATLIERVRLDIFEKQMIGSGEISNLDLQKILDTYFLGVPSELPETATELEAIELISRDGGYKIKIGEIYKGSVSSGSGSEEELPELPTGEGTIPYLPSSDFTPVEGTNLQNGLVIEDKAKNQYVWIEVPRTTTVYPNAGIGITSFTEAEYTQIEDDLHNYASEYRTNKNSGYIYTDQYFADTEEGWFSGEAQYNTAKQNMLKSVYNNGGFWIGRYEAGIETNRTEKGTATEAPLSRENLYPYTYVTRTQAKVLAEKVNSGSYTSSLMFGTQWDLVLKYIEVKSVEQGVELATIQSEIKNGGSWGNYYDVSFTLDRGKYCKYDGTTTWALTGIWNAYTENTTGLVENKEKKSTDINSDKVLLTTGASDRNRRQNIYDLSGNVTEWTLERCSQETTPCTSQGGRYLDSGEANSVAYPVMANLTRANDNYGFRVSIY